jgi:osmotically-inducible protein OsmY
LSFNETMAVEERMHKPNNLLEFDVRDTLEWDSGINALRIVVNADAGRVTLTGSVPSYHDKVRAAEDAWTVGGVKALENELLVGPAGEAIDDAALAAACMDALDHDAVVPKGSVTVSVKGGNVQLRGTVRNMFEHDAAEWVVSRVRGVVGIENLIARSSEPIPTDISDRIAKAFARSAIVDETQIKVTNDGHTIYLDGMVPSHAADVEAFNITAAAPGVNKVVDRLTIE